MSFIFCRIREKRKLIVMESREKRKVEKPRMPRTGKKMDTDRMKDELGELGLEVDSDEEVSFLVALSFPLKNQK